MYHVMQVAVRKTNLANILMEGKKFINSTNAKVKKKKVTTYKCCGLFLSRCKNIISFFISGSHVGLSVYN